MPIQLVVSDRKHKPVKIWTEDVDAASIDQLVNTASMPFIHKHVAAMPDVHLGIGATIGSVIPTYDAIMPAAVGVDIGCGMNAIQLTLKASDMPDGLNKLRIAIEKRIPLGPGGGHTDDRSFDFLTQAYSRDLFDWMEIEHPKMAKDPREKARKQMGSLGSGNHFIEICLDEDDYVWVMLHSGSRGIGNQIGRYFIDRAKEQMELWHIDLPDNDLAYLPAKTPVFDQYMRAVEWAQRYALENRRQMMYQVLMALVNDPSIPPFITMDEGVNCHHNYVAIENHYGKNVYVTRKGAIRAREGDLGIIPGSMGARSYIVRGKGNPESFCSCSHGAGRTMSRSEAAKRYTADDLAAQTQGIECPKDKSRVDEIPAAYKNIDRVMEFQNDLVEVVHTLRQIINIKG